MKGRKEKNKNLVIRPPVVVVLGHVDHGKSSILERIKDLKITGKESGGITQHIGAYEIVEKGKKITFIDTPGHEAFSAMRSRGAKMADIAILVVAGEEGVKPQTKEAIGHIKKAEIPIIVAINKIDKPETNMEKVKRELAEQGILAESMGGKIPCLGTSAKTGKGIPELLELVLLVAEMEDLKADISKPAEGVVIESYLDANRGPTATLILKDGVLKKGDVLGTSSTFGKIRIIEDFQAKSIAQALPSMPVVVLGFETVPGIGERFKVFENIEKAKQEIKGLKWSKSQVFDIKPEQRVLNLVLKTDVLGSLEAIEEILKEIPQEKVVLRILEGGVGEINESDVKLASGARAVIVGFRIKSNQIAGKLALRAGVRILNFELIYELAQTVRQLMEKRVEPETVKKSLGKVKVLAIFKTEKNRQIIGGRIVSGKILKGASLEIFRNEEKVGSGKIVTLKRDQNEVGQVEKGKECGILYEGDVEIEEGDIFEVYIKERIKGEL